MRLGLCCQFFQEPIAFRTTTARALAALPRPEALAKLSSLCLHNAESLRRSLEFCSAHGIGAFRILSQVFPLKTHPSYGYDFDELPGFEAIERAYAGCGELARRLGIRTSLHPDQFVVLNSRREEVVAASVQELEYQAQVAEWCAADVVNVHGGGAFGDKPAALADFERALDRLSDRARSRLTVENDDTVFTPADLLPLCRRTGVPLVYDVHHHRCKPDGLGIGEATALAAGTWTKREPYMHISSPLGGWGSRRPASHADYIEIGDWPSEWDGVEATVDVEAKAKELAVRRLQRELSLA
jgi:UV DNA damage endonuclease